MVVSISGSEMDMNNEQAQSRTVTKEWGGDFQGFFFFFKLKLEL